MYLRDAAFQCDSKDCKVFPQMFAHLTWRIQMSAIDVITKIAITLYC